MRPQALNIALFTYSTKPRGSVVHTLELAEALQDLGHQVCIYALDKDGSGFYRLPRCGFRLVSAQPITGGIDELIKQRIQEFVDYFSPTTETYDCYHAQDCISANALAVLKAKKQIPHFIRTVHHLEDFASPYLQACQDASVREPDLCLCVSAQSQSELRQKYQIEAQRVTNGINLKRFSASTDGSELELKSKLGLTGWPIYLTVGGIEPRKNAIALLEAFIKVLSLHPSAQLVIAGGATLFDYQSYRQAFFTLVEQASVTVGTSLILPGVIPDQELPALYRLADGFVFPSLKEGWGLVVLEALASGTPVITSNEPPFTEFLSGKDALLVDPRRVDLLAQAMQAVLQPQVAKQLIWQGRVTSARYTWEYSAELHLLPYQKLLSNGSPATEA